MRAHVQFFLPEIRTGGQASNVWQWVFTPDGIYAKRHAALGLRLRDSVSPCSKLVASRLQHAIMRSLKYTFAAMPMGLKSKFVAVRRFVSGGGQPYAGLHKRSCEKGTGGLLQ